MIRESVYFNGKNSLTDLGLTVAERRHEGGELCQVTETVPFRDRPVDLTRIDGKAHYKPKREIVVFNLIAKGPVQRAHLESQVREWLESSAGGDLHFATEPGRTYTHVTAVVSPPEIVSPRTSTMTVAFVCDSKVTTGYDVVTLLSDVTKDLGGLILVSGDTITAGDFSGDTISVTQTGDNAFDFSETPSGDICMVISVVFPEPYEGSAADYGQLIPMSSTSIRIDPAKRVWSDSQHYKAWYYIPAQYAGAFAMTSWEQSPTLTGVACELEEVSGADAAGTLSSTGSFYINSREVTELVSGTNVVTLPSSGTDHIALTQSIPKEAF